jgi:RNA polymerase sigma-70 factor (ECF subfamily)
MTANLTDEQLVRRTLDGDTEAFGEIVRRWERKIFALCYGMLGCKEEALDATQETFMLAYKNLKGFRGDSKISSWLHRIAVNQCLTRMRNDKKASESYLEDEIENNPSAIPISPENASPLKAVERRERIEFVRKAMSSLPVELKQVLIMKEFEEMTFQEIAEILDIPVSTVKSRLYLALSLLRRKLEQKFIVV